MDNPTVERRAIAWLLSNDTGISSKALCGFMLGVPVKHSAPPSDADDRGRCIRLLDAIPEWWERLDFIAEADTPRESLVIGAGGMRTETNSWAQQIPLIKQEGGR